MLKLLILFFAALTLWGCSDMGDKVTDINPNPPETLLSFTADIRPIFVANCASCHLNGAANGNLQLDSHLLLMSTGLHFPVIIPSNPDSSYLIQKIEGRAGDRMPLGGFLGPSDSLKIRTWISQGALDN
jgi:hypothetical protein